MIFKAEEFNTDFIKDIPVCKRSRGNPHGKKKTYKDIITAFDIETSTLPDIEENFMYIWQMQIGLDKTVIGRTWPQLFNMLKAIRKMLKRSHQWLVIYVHNLSYEFQYLKGWYRFQPDEVFCTDSRKVLKCTMFDCIEFRCSYLLTNMSLDQFTYQMKIENKKLSGFDYNKIRYPDTELSEFELQYCINDVQGLVQALYKSFSIEGDNVLTVPLTSTGYVRRDTKRAMEEYNHEQLQEMLPDIEVYTLLREAFRGGNTHANRWYTGDILENVKSIDEVSAYPSVMMNCLYPMMKFYREPLTSIKRLKALIWKHKKPVLMRIAFHDIDLKDILQGAPYLSRDKCRNIENGVYDNGRILRADYLETTITDLDFKIILGMYKWQSCNPYEVYTSVYKPLPEQLKNVVRKYYVDKTVLKGNEEMEVYYTKSKNKLNSCYGMTAQDPVKQSIEFINNGYQLKNESIEDLLNASNKNAFLSYAWGVWVTAWARYRLQEGINLAGHNFVYCDTDSVKYIGELDISKFNKERMKESKLNNAYAKDEKGITHYMGVFESEGCYDRFKTLGAKKYVYEQNGKLHITIAGVNKKLGPAELGSIENFREGFTFYSAGGTESVFNDNIRFITERDGHRLEIRDNIVIKPSMYTIGLTAEYKAILDGLIEIKYSDHTIEGYYNSDTLAQVLR